jgi:alpha-L-fucosidase
MLMAAATVTPLAALSEETKEQRDARMQWWREAKFGMFIHWGVYAVPAGAYKGQQIRGIGEWIMRNAEIPISEYRAFARQFNPVKYDPESWARLAREAGMKYMVITSKHHDGFALFPSEVTDWDVRDATPYGKDLLGPLAEAARRNGLKFGLYYSQAQDWTHPGGAKARLKEGEGWDEVHKGSFDDYLKNIAVPQTREILSAFKPDILWWDTPVWMNPERATPLNQLIALRPGLITNNRLGGGFRGDTETPEQYIPATGFPDRDWETCMTMNDTWGFKSYDHNWKSTETLIRFLVDIVSKGGNYLLNVGPTAEGEVPQPSIERLRQMGAWMKINGEAVYETTASPFRRLRWGRCTKKVGKDGATLYLHVFEWPTDGRLEIPGLRSAVRKARVLATGVRVKTKSQDGNVILFLPARAPDPIASVIVLQVKGPIDVDQMLPKAGPDGSISLVADAADVHNSLRAHARLQGKGVDAVVTDWDHPESRVSWDFEAPKGGSYKVRADISGAGGGRLRLEIGKTATPASIQADPSLARRTVELGTVSIPVAGVQTLQLRPEAEGWQPIQLHKVLLIPE